MIRAKPPLLTRLRRHRGLWMLAVAVLLIKLVTSSICLGDGLKARLVDAKAATSALVVMDSATTDASDESACLLGEPGGCHCVCAHALTLTTNMTLFVAPVDATMESSRLSLGLVPDTTGSLLRPPIS
ncbi:MAG: hypothetical protein EPN49_06775 [Rhodanobacter sp.]|nr:MAG: hypothetical protein EPN49_06775 [Rhodanobacter sp.]